MASIVSLLYGDGGTPHLMRTGASQGTMKLIPYDLHDKVTLFFITLDWGFV